MHLWRRSVRNSGATTTSLWAGRPAGERRSPRHPFRLYSTFLISGLTIHPSDGRTDRPLQPAFPNYRQRRSETTSECLSPPHRPKRNAIRSVSNPIHACIPTSQKRCGKHPSSPSMQPAEPQNGAPSNLKTGRPAPAVSDRTMAEETRGSDPLSLPSCLPPLFHRTAIGRRMREHES